MISIIMTIYMEPWEWIEESVDSVLNQTYKNAEFIIVIDNPTFTNFIKLKNKLESSDIEFQILRNSKNVGLVSSLNKGLKMANGSYIARMDADDISKPERLERELDFLEKNDLDFVASDVSYFGGNTAEYDRVKRGYNYYPKDIKRIERYMNCFWHPSWLGKRKVFDDLAGYRAIPNTEDYDFVVRAIMQGFRLGQVGDRLVSKRVNPDSISESNGFYQIKVAELIRKYYRKNQPIPIISVQNITTKNKCEVKFIQMRERFKTRKELLLNDKLRLIFSLFFKPYGKLFIKNVLIQKYFLRIYGAFFKSNFIHTERKN